MHRRSQVCRELACRCCRGGVGPARQDAVDAHADPRALTNRRGCCGSGICVASQPPVSGFHPVVTRFPMAVTRSLQPAAIGRAARRSVFRNMRLLLYGVPFSARDCASCCGLAANGCNDPSVIWLSWETRTATECFECSRARCDGRSIFRVSPMHGASHLECAPLMLLPAELHEGYPTCWSRRSPASAGGRTPFGGIVRS